MDKLISIIKNHYPIIIVAILLFTGVFKLPYGYYTFLRLVVSFAAGFLTYLNFKNNNKLWMIIFGLTTILFNPVFPIYLNRSIWGVIDIVVGIIFLVSIKNATNYSIKNGEL